MKSLEEMREELEKQIKRIAEVEEIKIKLEANEMRSWKCVGIWRKNNHEWELTYRINYTLCGKERTEDRVFPIYFVSSE